MKSIRVSILGRDYALRVSEDDEAQTRRLADYVNQKMQAFQNAHPEQAELTTAVITALALAEELHDQQTTHAQKQQRLNGELDALADRLADALAPAPDREHATS